MVSEPVPGEAAVLAGIVEVASRQLKWQGGLARDMPLLETFDLDSLRQLTLVVAIEDRFRIRLDDENAESISTVGDLVDAIRRKLASRAPDAV